jgi:hypothetical protein
MVDQHLEGSVNHPIPAHRDKCSVRIIKPSAKFSPKLAVCLADNSVNCKSTGSKRVDSFLSQPPGFAFAGGGVDGNNQRLG